MFTAYQEWSCPVLYSTCTLHEDVKLQVSASWNLDGDGRDVNRIRLWGFVFQMTEAIEATISESLLILLGYDLRISVPSNFEKEENNVFDV